MALLRIGPGPLSFRREVTPLLLPGLTYALHSAESAATASNLRRGCDFQGGP